MFMSHYHDQEDGYSHIEDAETSEDDDGASVSSIVHHSDNPPSPTGTPAVHCTIQDIKGLADLSQEVTITAEVRAYLHNLVVFLRLNRAVAKGVSPTATKHFLHLSQYAEYLMISYFCIADTPRILTAIHGQSFATPAIIGLAFRKIYRHRVQITTPDFERSVQYGSHPKTVAPMLKGLSTDMILENVLQELEVPV